jgi:hypothetical protein
LVAAVAGEGFEGLIFGAVGVVEVTLEELAFGGGVGEGWGEGLGAGLGLAGLPEVVGLGAEAGALVVAELAEGADAEGTFLRGDRFGTTARRAVAHGRRAGTARRAARRAVARGRGCLPGLEGGEGGGGVGGEVLEGGGRFGAFEGLEVAEEAGSLLDVGPLPVVVLVEGVDEVVPCLRKQS